MKKYLISLLIIIAVSFICFTRIGQHRQLGDINGDSNITITDLTTLRKHTSAISRLSYFQHIAADINGDGDVNELDLKILRRMLAGIE